MSNNIWDHPEITPDQAIKHIEAARGGKPPPTQLLH